MKRGRIGWETHVAGPLAAARRAALGDGADGEPRVLVRVDEFPHARAFDSAGPYGTERFRRFHAVLAEAGIPYLLAITPRVSRDYLEPAVSEWRSLEDGEVERLRALADDGVVFGLHGLDHRTRHASPRRRSELCGLSVEATAERVDLARNLFDELGFETPVFVAPFNRFDRRQYQLLAKRFEVVCGGPESIRLLGFAPTPAWRGEAVYLPSYPPLYGTAATAAAGVARLVERRAAIWAPLTLHWGWETRDDFAGLRRLCRLLAGHAREWGEFLRAVEKSRAAA
jgi:peptidoglycan/xylan/chitin deacetylase (PgdA/CDA1 family)